MYLNYQCHSLPAVCASNSQRAYVKLSQFCSQTEYDPAIINYTRFQVGVDVVHLQNERIEKVTATYAVRIAVV